MTKVVEQPSPLMDVWELAEYLSCHTSTVYRMLKRGGLPAFKIGDSWRFDRRNIDEWMKRQTLHELKSAIVRG